MALINTYGLVHKLTLIRPPAGPAVCMWIGASPAAAELFFMRLDEGDPDRSLKSSMVSSLAVALGNRLGVAVNHDDSSGLISYIVLSGIELYSPP